jgi:BirA family biotin operon repressor/biotin-[acetyl-CoA-carboxylase] ligase
MEHILSILRKKDDFVSGEEISSVLGITRASIWKKVNHLREKGYVINAVPSKGYRLLSSPDTPTPEEISSIFKGDIIGREYIFLNVTGSTNEKAMELGQLLSQQSHLTHTQKKDKISIDGTVIIADSQTYGKGRLGRTWFSPPGVNLYFTVLLEPPIPVKESSLITLMAAVSVVTAIRDHVGLKAVIKWPNDILVGDKKTGGILTEMKSDIDRINFLAVGIGINVNMPGKILPGHLKNIATSLKEESGHAVNRVELLGGILSCFENLYKILLRGRRSYILNEWLRLNSTVGRRVRVHARDRVITGMAKGIGNDGELIIRIAPGKVEKVYAGEVTILK